MHHAAKSVWLQPVPPHGNNRGHLTRLPNFPEPPAIGITIAYRGKFSDLTRIEDFEDRLLDLALDLGGQAQIWRSSADADPSRIIRGIILNQAPGQESTSLLISPEGYLIGLMEIEDAECGRVIEPPWCFVKTQFGSLEGHVALVEIFAALKREFIPDLEVSDEGGYWETRDLDHLRRNFTTLQAAIDGMAAGFKAHGLSREAAEDPAILMQRIARIAEKVRQSLGRPTEHVFPFLPDEGNEDSDDSGELEARWDELYKHSRRSQERFHRLMEERLARGEDYETAMDGALQDAGLADPADAMSDEDGADAFAAECEWSDEDDSDFEAEVSDDDAEDAGDEDETPGDRNSGEGPAAADAERDRDPFDRDRHPLLERASQFWLRLHELFKEGLPGEKAAPGKSAAESALHTLFQGAGDLCGGLAQALTRPEDYPDRGLCVVQLKRALRGLAFTRGGLCNLSSSDAMPEAVVKSLHATLDGLETDIFQELGRARESA